jgi:hypothetical protein
VKVGEQEEKITFLQDFSSFCVCVKVVKTEFLGMLSTKNINFGLCKPLQSYGACSNTDEMLLFTSV